MAGPLIANGTHGTISAAGDSSSATFGPQRFRYPGTRITGNSLAWNPPATASVDSPGRRSIIHATAKTTIATPRGST